MAISFVSETKGQIAAGVGGVEIAPPAGLAIGDYILYAAVCDSSLAFDGPSDETWLTWAEIANPGGISPGVRISLGEIVDTPGATFTQPRNGSKVIAYAMQGWRGVDTSTPQDATATEDSGSSDSPDPPSIVTVTAGARVIAIALLDDDDTTVSTWPSGYGQQIEENTNQASTTDGATVAMSSIEKGSAGTEDPSAYQMGSSDGWEAWTVALRPAAGGGSTVPPIVDSQYRRRRAA